MQHEVDSESVGLQVARVGLLLYVVTAGIRRSRWLVFERWRSILRGAIATVVCHDATLGCLPKIRIHKEKACIATGAVQASETPALGQLT